MASETNDAVFVDLERVRTALSGLRFGSIELQVHDSRVVRITRTEKIIVDGARPDRTREGPR